MWEHISPTCNARGLYDQLALIIHGVIQKGNIECCQECNINIMEELLIFTECITDAVAQALHDDNIAFNEARFRAIVKNGKIP